MNPKYIVMATLLALSSDLLAFNDDELVQLVINASSKDELYGSPNPTMEQRRRFWSMPDRLVEIVESDPQNDTYWKALHKFRDFSDAGVSESYAVACLLLLQRKPIIFFERYLRGDKQALDRAKNAVMGDLSTGNSIILNSIRLVKEHDTKHSKLQKQFIKAIEEQYTIRQEEFSR